MPGDSGGPVLALRDGKREFVGLTSSVVMGPNGQFLNFCYILSVDQIKIAKAAEMNPRLFFVDKRRKY